MAVPSHTIRICESLGEIPPQSWAALEQENFPFTDYGYLSALEASGCVGADAGWVPQHLTAWEGEQLVGATPLYLKDNSYGEYIFDWDWARAYAEHGLAYYPKLVSASPFTPATGPKFALSPRAGAETATRLLTAACERMESLGAGSLHYLFLPESELSLFAGTRFLLRHSFQYHWRNPGYASFDAFLAELKSAKRKQIHKERREVAALGLKFSVLRGPELTSELARLFHAFYLSTTEKMGAIAYLNQAFYERVFASLPEQVVLFLAVREGVPVAAALCYQKGKHLYGRYWGARQDIRNLHFELCYYQPIEYAIAQGLTLFEAGAQGEHKIARGFLPTLTHSAHWIRHASFRDAIGRFISQEKLGIARYFSEMNAHSPFRANEAGRGETAPPRA